MNVRPLLAAGLFAMAAFAGTAKAQDFMMTSGSARSNAMGGTYVPSSSDVLDALTTNPAGLTYLRGKNLNLQADVIFARGDFSNSVNDNSPMKNSPGVAPFGAFGMPIGKSRFSFGVGFVPDMLSVSDWKYVDAPGAAGATYGLQTQKSAILSFRSVAGVGFAINSRLSIGATFGADYNRNTLQAPYIFQEQPELAGAKTLLDLHTDGVGYNTSVGVIAKPTNTLQFGASWKSRTVIESTGHASGDVYAQFAALGIDAASDFTYDAKVRNVLPQTVSGNIAWQANRRWLFAGQMDWVNWHDSFVKLPVTLTNGTNETINSVVDSTTLIDGVPLNWKDQYVFHVGAEHNLTESTQVRFGYAHANSPVPDSTLTPLTAAIMTNQISGGFAYNRGRSRWDIAYSYHPKAEQSVAQSSLLLDEYDNSRVRVGTQSLIFGYSFKF